jgi:hypothetical protein
MQPRSSRRIVSFLGWFILSALKSALKSAQKYLLEMVPGTSLAAFSSLYVMVKRYLMDMAGGFGAGVNFDRVLVLEVGFWGIEAPL